MFSDLRSVEPATISPGNPWAGLSRSVNRPAQSIPTALAERLPQTSDQFALLEQLNPAFSL